MNSSLDLERGGPQVGLMKASAVETRIRHTKWGTHQVLSELREQGLRLVVSDGGVNNDIITLLPVHGGGNTMLVAKLEGYKPIMVSQILPTFACHWAVLTIDDSV